MKTFWRFIVMEVPAYKLFCKNIGNIIINSSTFNTKLFRDKLSCYDE